MCILLNILRIMMLYVTIALYYHFPSLKNNIKYSGLNFFLLYMQLKVVLLHV